MAWTAPTTQKLLMTLTPQEAAGVKALKGGLDTCAEFLSQAVAELRDFIMGGGYPVDLTDATTLPLGLHSNCYAIARWNLLISCPHMKIIQTDERKEAYDQALKKGDAIANQRLGVEPPVPDEPPKVHTGNWGSENKLIMRTHPVPPPATQYQQQAGDYPNPDQPEDNS